MTFFTKEQERKLEENGRRNSGRILKKGRPKDFPPVVKLISGNGRETWLLSEISWFDSDVAYGLYYNGLENPQLGSIRISKLIYLSDTYSGIRRDRNFQPNKTLNAYAEEAARAGRTVL